MKKFLLVLSAIAFIPVWMYVFMITVKYFVNV